MKKKIAITAIGILGLSAGLMTQGMSAEAATKQTLIESKQTLKSEKIQAKLEMIRKKAGEEVKNKVAEKIKEKETKIAEQAAAQVAAEQVVVDQAGWGNDVDTTSGASQSGREIGQTNREYGQQLSDPNLSQDQRQQIIQEKKNYNRGRR